ncbi:unnamed protein product [Merluccius merluccius]
MMELNTRFKADTYGFMRAAAACLPWSDTFGDKALIQPACAQFSILVEDAEHTVFVQQLKRKAKANKTMTRPDQSPVGPPHIAHDDMYCEETLFSCQSDKNRHQGNNVDR